MGRVAGRVDVRVRCALEIFVEREPPVIDLDPGGIEVGTVLYVLSLTERRAFGYNIAVRVE